jgi:hypothetical protein
MKAEIDDMDSMEHTNRTTVNTALTTVGLNWNSCKFLNNRIMKKVKAKNNNIAKLPIDKLRRFKSPLITGSSKHANRLGVTVSV